MKKIKWRVMLIVSICFIAFCIKFSFMGKPAEISEKTLVGIPAKALVETLAKASVGTLGFQIRDCVLTAYTGNDRVVTIPDGVKEIGSEAFKGSKVQKVVLPASVEKIGGSAFCGCKKLESVILPEGVTDIGNLAFCECKKLQSISLPDSLRIIRFDAFSGSGLTDIVIPPSMTEIGFSVFSECKKLKRIQFPEQLKVIDSSAFKQCYALEKVTIPESVTKIGSEAFAYCYNLKKVVIDSDKIKKVGEHPFLFHSANRKVISRKKVSREYKEKFNYQDYITKGAILYHKTSCSTVDMCGVKFTKKGKLAVPEKVGKYSVTGVKNVRGMVIHVIDYRHKGITEVELADTITQLGTSVFEFSKFKKIKFPANLIRIKSSALFGNHLEEINLPPRLEYIGENAFVRLYSESEINAIPKKGLKNLPKSIVLPNSVQRIKDGNFGYCYVVYSVEGDDAWAYMKIKGYKVIGKKGSYAQKYAKKHELKFVPIN